MAKRKRRIFTPEFKAEVVLEALRCRSLHRAFYHKRSHAALGCLMPVAFEDRNLS